jgi:ATP-dependent RNA helicase RhlE
VINYDIPNVPETYVHRIGRTGRAGETGLAISISEPEENIFVRDIEKLINHRIPVGDPGEFPQTDKPMNKQEKKAWNKAKAKRRSSYHSKRKMSRV